MSSEDERTCLVCGKGGGSFTRAVPYMCRDCHARLSPAQRVELQAIRKKAHPGMAGAIVCTFAALLFFILNVSIRTYPLVRQLIPTFPRR